MTLRELIQLQLKSGTRPPLLSDVLDSALRIGDSKMAVELKPGNGEMGSALCRLFTARPDLLGAVGLFMSFDLYLMHEFVKLFDKLVFPEGVVRPFFLLLTVKTSEQHLAGNEGCVPLSVGHHEDDLDFLSPQIESWLNRPDSKLDGLYIQFENEMVTNDQFNGGYNTHLLLSAISKKYKLGVWGHTEQIPDRCATASILVESGVHFVNTDLPRAFIPK